MKHRVDELHNLYEIACQLEFKMKQCESHNYTYLAQSYSKLLGVVNQEIKTLHYTLFEGGDSNE